MGHALVNFYTKHLSVVELERDALCAFEGRSS